MHIILGALTSLVTILWLLHRLAEMGIDLGGLNPWLWGRRRRWKKKFEANPAFAIESPLEASALLLTCVAKADGDMTSEEKQCLLGLFQDEFHLSEKDAASLLSSSVYLLRDGEEVRSNLEGVLSPSLETFTADQASSVMAMMTRIGNVGAAAGAGQQEIMGRVEEIFARRFQSTGKWG